MLVVDEGEARAKSRLTAIRLTLLTLRCMENWRRDVYDYDSAMVLVAVVAISSERLTRAELDPALGDLAVAFPREELTRCNVASIAAATGLNRETARRRVNRLVERGRLVRGEDGTVDFPPGRLQDAATLELVRKQLDTIVRTVNELCRDGVLRIS